MVVTWSLAKYVSGATPSVEERVEGLEQQVGDINEAIEGAENHLEYDTQDLADFPIETATPSGGTRGLICIPIAYSPYRASLSVSSNSPIKAALHIAKDHNWGNPNYDTGWITPGNSASISQQNDTAGTGKFIRVAATYVSGNTGVPTIQELTTYLTFECEMDYFVGGILPRLSALEAAEINISPRIKFANTGSNTVLGAKVDVADHTYTSAQLGSLSSGTSSRQGGAIFGDYLLQFHNTLASIIVFKLSTATNVQTFSLTAMANCHAGSGGFSNVYHTPGDPFPLLYISSMDEKKVYVYRITGTEGAGRLRRCRPSPSPLISTCPTLR